MMDIQKIVDIATTSGNAEDMWRCGYALLHGEFISASGVSHKCRRNVRKAVEWLEKAANAGCSGAMIELGCHYFYQKPQNRENLLRSLYWDELAWNSGEASAAQNMAVTYMHLGMPEKCHDWLKRGYKKCRWPVALSLAKTYVCGYGTKRDISKAKRILKWIVETRETCPDDISRARRYLEKLECGKIPKCDCAKSLM